MSPAVGWGSNSGGTPPPVAVDDMPVAKTVLIVQSGLINCGFLVRVLQFNGGNTCARWVLRMVLNEGQIDGKRRDNVCISLLPRKDFN